MVDVAAHHAIEAARLGLTGHRALEVVDEADGPLDLELQVARQAPVGQAHARPHGIDPMVQFQRAVVGPVAEVRQPFGDLDHAVEVVAVHHPEPASVGRGVDDLAQDLDAAEAVSQIAPGELVVVARHEHHPGALAHLAQQLLHHVVVCLRPVPLALELPAVDDVAHQVERVALHRLEELQQRLGLTAGRAQVQVGDPDGAQAQSALFIGVGRRLEQIGQRVASHEVPCCGNLKTRL